MNISDISLRDLEYLIAVSEHRHFGKAALALHVSQPALSAQIKKIESVLGMALFERTNKHVLVTSVGASIAAQAKEVLMQARVILTLTKSRNPILTGPFRLGAIASVGPYLFPHIIGALRQKHKSLELLLREGLTEDLLLSLKTGELDAVIASPTFDPKGLTLTPLYFEEFVLLCSTAHEFAARKTVSTRELKPTDMISLEDGHCLKDQILALCPTQTRGKALRYQATSLETLRYLVATEVGYTLIPKLAVRRESDLQKLVCYRRFSEKHIGRDVVLVTRKSSIYSKDSEALAKIVRENVRQLKIA